MVATESLASDKKRRRLVSLDVFRGATILLMILVNNPGSWAHVYPPLLHAKWHGWTPTDLVFPFFLFIVGVAIVLAYTRRLEQGIPRRALVQKAIRRTIILFLLGVFLAAWPVFQFSPEFGLHRSVARLRIMGVLQRIALCYLAASLLFLYSGNAARIIWSAALLIGYWAAMTLIPVPGYGAGMLDEPVATLSAYLDRLILGTNHLWAGAGREWDPEGLLSTVPAIVTVLLGIKAGEIISNDSSPTERVAKLCLTGFGLMTLGYVWDWFFPINKALWTSSYVCMTAGLAMCTLAACYWFIDVKGWSGWTRPFVIYGLNALTVFFLSGILAKTLGLIKVTSADGELTSLHGVIYRTVFLPLASPINASLMFAIAWIVLWYLIMDVMYRRNIVIKV